MKSSYYNTTGTVHPELGQYEKKAKSQEDKILEWFKTYEQPGGPSDINDVVFGNSVPITSVRRAMTNLTNNGELVKTDRQVKGFYGRPEHLWSLAPKYSQREMF